MYLVQRHNLNTESVKEMISELTEEDRIDEEENENVLQAADSLTEDWIGLVGASIGLDEFKYDDLIGVFSVLRRHMMQAPTRLI